MDTVHELAQRLLREPDLVKDPRSQYAQRRHPQRVARELQQFVMRYRRQLADLGDPPVVTGQVRLFCAELLAEDREERQHLQDAIVGANDYRQAVVQAMGVIGRE